MARFELEYDKAQREIEAAIDKTVRGAALELFSAIVKSTPVGNPSLWQNSPPAGYTGGSLRNNWQFTLGRPAVGEVSGEDASGASTISRATNVAVRYRTGDIYFTNNLPYAQRVEDGWSSQRPQGMVKSNITRFSVAVETEARKNKV